LETGFLPADLLLEPGDLLLTEGDLSLAGGDLLRLAPWLRTYANLSIFLFYFALFLMNYLSS
jgi:hypothetical protein